MENHECMYFLYSLTCWKATFQLRFRGPGSVVYRLLQADNPARGIPSGPGPIRHAVYRLVPAQSGARRCGSRSRTGRPQSAVMGVFRRRRCSYSICPGVESRQPAGSNRILLAGVNRSGLTVPRTADRRT